ncbi:hypothetical protein CMUS01_11340 [Colletotrichum musicola]|uniref:Secreted protein n=1 Tax=Colletotrichum musicola TaxID=2175873 RepID=A0A8H6N636_9PEZI|nr:hypothetical protein CMUS01_11340 [Colletotrichum musicola]
MRSGYLHVVALLSLNGLVGSTPAPRHDPTPHAPVVPRSPFPNRNVFVPQWEVQAHRDGENIRLNGTVEEVLKQLRSINPDYDSHFGLDEGDEEAETGLQKRQIPGTGTNVLFETVICDNFEKTEQKRINEGVKYLRRIKGRPQLSAGPQECGRVSCAYNAAIWWCNDVSSLS